MERKASYAGTWYPRGKEEIEKYIDLSAKKEKVIACVCPHAGWMYSGSVAGRVYSRIEIPDICILIGPNHTGVGPLASIYTEGSWEMPLGKVDIASELVKLILKNSEFLEGDTRAHLREHSLEVQIPFIQYFNPKAKIVPTTVRGEEMDLCKDIAQAVVKAVKELQKEVLIIASTDMTHYEPQEIARKKDHMAIEHILNLDPEGLYHTVLRSGISMCGVIPTTIVLIIAKGLGATKTELVKYATSGDITGDYDAVVGYAGLVIK